MESGFVALGILCILYYCFISWHTKKLNSTFSWFWILLALWCVILAVLTDISPDWLDSVILGCNVLVAKILYDISIIYIEVGFANRIQYLYGEIVFNKRKKG